MIKLGRPPKIKRNLEICKLIDEQRMTRREIMATYNLSESRLCHVIKDNWKEYIKGRTIKKIIK